MSIRPSLGMGSNWEDATVFDWRDDNEPAMAAAYPKAEYVWSMLTAGTEASGFCRPSGDKGGCGFADFGRRLARLE